MGVTFFWGGFAFPKNPGNVLGAPHSSGKWVICCLYWGPNQVLELDASDKKGTPGTLGD